MTQARSLWHAGIDVSAQTLEVALRSAQGRLWVGPLPNTAAGHRRLRNRLTRSGRQARVAVEATGTYHLDLCVALAATEGIEVMVVNPRAMHNFARAVLTRSKTDRQDAVIALEYLERMPWRSWQPPSAAAWTLRALARRITALKQEATRERNRRAALGASTGSSTLVARDIEVNLRHLERRIERLQAQALDLLRATPALARDLELLLSVPGIGTTSAVQLLGELGVLPEDMRVRQWVAHAGLDPRRWESGSSVRRPARISRTGNAHLRAALFLPALTAARHDPHLRAFYRRLLERGKAPLQALAAVMRKLLHALYGILRHQQSYNGNRLVPNLAQEELAA